MLPEENELYETYLEYKKMLDVYKKIIGKLIVYDPLERPLFEYENGVEQDICTKREDLLGLIGQLKPVKGDCLTIPLSDGNIKIIENMIGVQSAIIASEAKIYQNRINSEGTGDLEPFLENVIVKETLKIYQLFEEHKLMSQI